MPLFWRDASNWTFVKRKARQVVSVSNTMKRFQNEPTTQTNSEEEEESYTPFVQKKNGEAVPNRRHNIHTKSTNRMKWEAHNVKLTTQIDISKGSGSGSGNITLPFRRRQKLPHERYKRKKTNQLFVLHGTHMHIRARRQHHDTDLSLCWLFFFSTLQNMSL